MNNNVNNKKELLSIILKFNLIIGIYNLYLFSVGQSIFNLVIGWMNIGVWRFFRNLSLIPMLSKYNKNKPDAKSVTIIIDTTKSKNATTKDSAGKVLEYRIILTSNIIIKDYLTDDKLLNKTFSYSSAYRTQDQHAETIKLENKSIEDLVNKIYQNLIIEMTQII